MKAKDFLKENAYIFGSKSEEFVISVSELISLLNDFANMQNKELVESLKDELARIVLLSEGYEDLEQQNKEQIENLKMYVIHHPSCELIIGLLTMNRNSKHTLQDSKCNCGLNKLLKTAKK